MNYVQISDVQREQILDELKRTPDESKVARRLGLPVRIIRDIHINDGQHCVVSEDGLGRPELRQYIIAIKHVDDVWDNRDPKIMAARTRYDAGEVEVVTGRDGFNLILYSIPRKNPDPNRRVYFARRFEEE